MEAAGFEATSGLEPVVASEEAARFLNINPKTLQKMARDGEVPAYRIGKLWKFRINNGQPSVHARWLEAVSPPPGESYHALLKTCSADITKCYGVVAACITPLIQQQIDYWRRATFLPWQTGTEAVFLAPDGWIRLAGPCRAWPRGRWGTRSGKALTP